MTCLFSETADFPKTALLLLLSVILLAAAGYWIYAAVTSRRYPYQSRLLLTDREYSFYLLLRREAAQRGLLICPKVGLKDLIEVSTARNYMKYFHRIAQKHIDFVICDQSLRVLFAIELDDSSHDTKEARKRDHFKDQALRAARIPLKRIREFDEISVRNLFR